MLKKAIFSGLGVALLVLPLSAAADTNYSSDVNTQIQSLQQQIQDLLKQITQLRGEATSSGAFWHGDQQSVASSTQGPGGASCISYHTTYVSGATVGCTVQPGSGVPCPLGRDFSRWQCTDGTWVQSGNEGGGMFMNWFGGSGSSATSTWTWSSQEANNTNTGGSSSSHATSSASWGSWGSAATSTWKWGGASTSSCFSLARDLAPGDSDRDTDGSVSKLQQYLRGSGDYTFPSVTGYYGTSTRDAVEHWQARFGVATSGTPWTTGFGRVGPMTRNAFAHWCAVSEASSSSSSPTTTSVEWSPSSTTPDIASSTATSTKPLNPVRCITPWGGYSVQDGSTMSYRPYFTDGSFEGTSTALMRCDHGGWLKCDTQGSTCQHFLGSLSQVLSGQ